MHNPAYYNTARENPPIMTLDREHAMLNPSD